MRGAAGILRRCARVAGRGWEPACGRDLARERGQSPMAIMLAKHFCR